MCCFFYDLKNKAIVVANVINAQPHLPKAPIKIAFNKNSNMDVPTNPHVESILKIE